MRVCARARFLTCLARVIKDERRVGVGWKFSSFSFSFFPTDGDSPSEGKGGCWGWEVGSRGWGVGGEFSNCGNDAITLCHKSRLCKFAICHAAPRLCRWKLGRREIAANYSITALDGEADPAWQRWQRRANHLPQMALN